MFATVIGQAFSDWVEGAISERNSGLADKSGLMVGMNPEVAKVFAASTNLSSRYIITYFFIIPSPLRA